MMRVEMNCPQCNYPYAPGSRFCGNCGFNLAELSSAPPFPETPATAPEPTTAPEPAEIAAPEIGPRRNDLICPRCGQANNEDSAYCYACGFPLVVAGQLRVEAGRLPAFEMGTPGSFWYRAIAYVIDTLVIVMPVVLLWMLSGQPLPENMDQILEPPAGYDRLQILLLFLSMAYDTALITYFATTVGKRAFGLYVVRSDGSRVGFVRALARHLLTAVSANLTLGLIFLVVLFRADRRGLHDLICDTVVIRRHRQRTPPDPGRE